MKAKKKVIALGMDGMDPRLVERWMEEGKLPNLSRLKELGTYSPLATTNPAQSPVAWTAFATGRNPGKTNMYDFMIRDPKTYGLDLGLYEMKFRRFGPPQISRRIKGDTIWKIVGDHGLWATVLHMPVTWPPEEINGQIVGGLGLPDASFTWASSALYATDLSEEEAQKALTGGRHIKIEVKDGKADTVLYGVGDKTVPLQFIPDPANRRVTIVTPGGTVTVGEREWSDWCIVPFRMMMLMTVRTVCRFYVYTVEPELRVYLCPLQHHPEKSMVSISHPASFARELYEVMGFYHTIGSPEDVMGIVEGRLDEEAYLSSVLNVVDEQVQMTLHLLNKGQADLLVSYFGAPDVTQHGFWRLVDKEHPLYDEEEARQYGDAILRIYQRLDEFLGQVLEATNENTALIVNSDHGTGNWRRVVHMNNWLLQHGYLVLKDESKATTGVLLDPSAPPWDINVDWSKTRAYALGLSGIYVNLQGREGQGTVARGEPYETLRDEIIQKFMAWKDPKTGRPVMRNVYKKEEIAWGDYVDIMPDLIIGFNEGYRLSWETGTGGIPLGEPLQDNLSKLSCDHLSVDPPLVPGILLCSERWDLTDREPNIIDLAPTILDLLGIEVPADMDGKSLLG